MLDLVWTAPEACPSQEWVANDVERLVGAPPAETRVHTVAVATRTAAGWQVKLRTVTSAGTEDRVFEGESCRAVAEAAALLVALSLDPQRATATASATATAPAAAAPPALAHADAHADADADAVAHADADAVAHADADALAHAPADAPAAAAASPLRPSLSLSPRLDSGTLPLASPGLDLSLRLRRSRASLDLSATDWLPQTARLSPSPSVTAHFTLLTAAVRGCYSLTPADSPLRLSPCLAFAFDHVDASASGDLTPTGGSTWWFDVAAGGRGEWLLTRWLSLETLVEADAPLTHPAFFVQNGSTSYRTAAAALRAGLGVALSFP